jgi:hypothetical protein
MFCNGFRKMSLSELLPPVKALSHADKLRLLSFLASELLTEAVLTPDHPIADATNELRQSFEAAGILSKALTEHQTATHG